ncbi:MAG: hypothetical protein J6V99_05765, partial [Neisseriaceae bacterium]|nr:hypothetical protein [Neisseriaceae bacterium]
DGDKIAYAVSDDRFEVVSGNLKLKSGVALDFEKEKTVTVKITAKDGKGLEDSETVKINVSNDTADDAKPEIAYDLDTKTISFKNLQPGAFKISIDGGKTWEDDATDKFPDSEITKNPDGTVTIKHPIEEDDEDWGDLPEKVNVAIQQNGHQANLEIDNPYPDSDQVRVHLAEDTGISNTDLITTNGKLIVDGVEGKSWVYQINDGNLIHGNSDGVILTGIDPNLYDSRPNMRVEVALLDDDGNLSRNKNETASIDFVLDHSADIQNFSVDQIWTYWGANTYLYKEKNGSVSSYMQGRTHAEALDVEVYQNGKRLDSQVWITNGALREDDGPYAYKNHHSANNKFAIVTQGLVADQQVEIRIKSYDSAGNTSEEVFIGPVEFDNQHGQIYLNPTNASWSSLPSDDEDSYNLIPDGKIKLSMPSDYQNWVYSVDNGKTWLKGPSSKELTFTADDLPKLDVNLNEYMILVAKSDDGKTPNAGVPQHYSFSLSSNDDASVVSDKIKVIEAKFEAEENSSTGLVTVKFDIGLASLNSTYVEIGDTFYGYKQFAKEWLEDADGNLFQAYVVYHQVSRDTQKDQALSYNIGEGVRFGDSIQWQDETNLVSGNLKVTHYDAPTLSNDDLKIYFHEDTGWSDQDNITSYFTNKPTSSGNYNFYNTIEISGMPKGYTSWQYSTDGGQTWEDGSSVHGLPVPALYPDDGAQVFQVRLLDEKTSQPIAGDPKTFKFVLDYGVEILDPSITIKDGKATLNVVTQEDVKVYRYDDLEHPRYSQLDKQLAKGETYTIDIDGYTGQEGFAGYLGFTVGDIAGNAVSTNGLSAVYLSDNGDYILGSVVDNRYLRLHTSNSKRNVLYSVDGGETWEKAGDFDAGDFWEGSTFIAISGLHSFDPSTNDGYNHRIEFKFADAPSTAKPAVFPFNETTAVNDTTIDFNTEIVHLDGNGHYAVTVMGKVNSSILDFSKGYTYVTVNIPQASSAIDAYDLFVQEDGTFGKTFEIEKQHNSDLVDAIIPIRVDTMDVIVELFDYRDKITSAHHKEILPEPSILTIEDSNGKLGTTGDDVLVWKGTEAWYIGIETCNEYGYIDGKGGLDTLELQDAFWTSHMKSIEKVEIQDGGRLYIAADDLALNADQNGNLWVVANSNSSQYTGGVTLMDAPNDVLDEQVTLIDGHTFHQYQYEVKGNTYTVMIDDNFINANNLNIIG